METALSFQTPVKNFQQPKKQGLIINQATASRQPGKIERTIIWWAIKIRIFYITCIVLKRPRLILKTFNDLLNLRNNVWGGDLKKIY